MGIVVSLRIFVDKEEGTNLQTLKKNPFQMVIPCKKPIGIVVVKMTLGLSTQQGIRQINTYRTQ